MFGEPVTGTVPTGWRALRASVRGAPHWRSGLPNQDAVRIAPCALAYGADSGAAAALVLALADGHGSPKSFRSQQGARLAVVVAFHAPAFILYLQLGDGNLLTVSADGRVRRPLPPDARLLGNETTSLYARQTLAGAPPALILAVSDGYANAFRDDDGFRQVAHDLWAMLRGEGEAGVSRHLRGWLDEASQQGSGDDISVGILWRAS